MILSSSLWKKTFHWVDAERALDDLPGSDASSGGYILWGSFLCLFGGLAAVILESSSPTLILELFFFALCPNIYFWLICTTLASFMWNTNQISFPHSTSISPYVLLWNHLVISHSQPSGRSSVCLQVSTCLFQVLMVQSSQSVSQVYLLSIFICYIYRDVLLKKEVPGNA